MNDAVWRVQRRRRQRRHLETHRRTDDDDDDAMSDQAVLLLRKQLKGAKTTRRDAPPFAGANRRARARGRERVVVVIVFLFERNDVRVVLDDDAPARTGAGGVKETEGDDARKTDDRAFL